jgi:aspartate 1-decarboxylase
MLIEMLQGKLHRGAVTSTRIDYEGSLSVDPDLYEAAGMREHQKIQVLDITNGARFETYLIRGERGTGEIAVNGAAARLVMPGDRVIVCAFALLNAAELERHHPQVVLLDERNRIVDRT